MYKSQKIVTKELNELFDIANNLEKGTYNYGTGFGISKKQLQRFEVIEVLQNYFKDVSIKDGYLSVCPITFIHTTFEVCNGTPVK